MLINDCKKEHTKERLKFVSIKQTYVIGPKICALVLITF